MHHRGNYIVCMFECFLKVAQYIGFNRISSERNIACQDFTWIVKHCSFLWSIVEYRIDVTENGSFEKKWQKIYQLLT